MKTKSNVQTMPQAAIDRFLSENRIGVLCLPDEKNPYGIPLAYFYEPGTVYLTLGRSGRKLACISRNPHAAFTVYRVPEAFGSPGSMSWTSVICEGVLENITDPDELEKAVRTGERHMGVPEGTWEHLLQMTLKNPGQSNFWKLSVTAAGGRSVEDEKVEFSE